MYNCHEIRRKKQSLPVHQSSTQHGHTSLSHAGALEFTLRTPCGHRMWIPRAARSSGRGGVASRKPAWVCTVLSSRNIWAWVSQGTGGRMALRARPAAGRPGGGQCVGSTAKAWAPVPPRILIFPAFLAGFLPDDGFRSRPSHILALILPIWGNCIILCLLIAHFEQHRGRFPLLPGWLCSRLNSQDLGVRASAGCLLGTAQALKHRRTRSVEAAASTGKATEELGQRKRCCETLRPATLLVLALSSEPDTEGRSNGSATVVFLSLSSITRESLFDSHPP